MELEEVGQLATEVLLLGAVSRGPDDHAASVEVERLRRATEPVTLLVLEPLGDAHPLTGRRVDEVAAGDGKVHGATGPLRLEGVLDDLDDDLLAGLQERTDPLSAAFAAPATRDLHPGQHDLVDVQEGVLLEADVDEGRLEAVDDVVDPRLVDVPDDGAAAPALDVHLGDAVTLRGVGARRRPGARPAGASGLFEQSEPGLPRVDAYEYLFLHDFSLFIGMGTPVPCRRRPGGPGHRSTAAGPRRSSKR